MDVYRQLYLTNIPQMTARIKRVAQSKKLVALSAINSNSNLCFSNWSSSSATPSAPPWCFFSWSRHFFCKVLDSNDLFMLKTSSRIDRKFSPSHSAAPISFPSSTSSLPPSTGAKSHRMHQPFSSFVCTSLSWWLTIGFSLQQTPNNFPVSKLHSQVVRRQWTEGNGEVWESSWKLQQIGQFRAFEVKHVRWASPSPKRGIKPGKHATNCLKKCG